jgi:hypothetical protein
VPQVAVGEDEFVELDEEGNPRRRSARPARPARPKPTAAVRRKSTRRPAVLPPAAAAAAAVPTDEAALDADVDIDDTAEVASGSVAAPTTLKRRVGGTNAPRRSRGNGA